MIFGMDYAASSFYELLRLKHPYLLPQINLEPKPISPTGGDDVMGHLTSVPHGTTILALKYRDGVAIGGDRRATEGFQVSARRIEKVYKADEHSAIAIAGAAGPCLEMAKLFQIELEHYEKLEGVSLTTEGKANKLAQLVKTNFPFAVQGLIVIPIFVGFDMRRSEGRIFKYDVTGGRYEETEYYAAGSGGKDARNSMKKLYKRDMTEEEAIKVTLEALYDAAEEDVGTAGPDLIKGIYPTVKTVTKQGINDVTEVKLKDFYTELIELKRGK